MSGLAWGLLCAILIGLIFFLALMESAITPLSRVSLRVLAEREKSPRLKLLEEISRDQVRFLLPIVFASQVVVVLLLTVLTLFLSSDGISAAPLWAAAITVLIIVLFRQLFPRWIASPAPERLLLGLLPYFNFPYRLVRWLSSPILIPLGRGRNGGSRATAHGDAEEDAGEEEIQAYLGVGEEEGIFEEEESELIQSALEFSDTRAREIMTPRTEIVAIDEGATIAELRDVIVSHKLSRIPVHRQGLDQIVGVVYVRNLLSYLGNGHNSDPITPLINKAWFVPETKKVSELLKEMQENAEHLAIVINEYGSVSGLVTLEDVVEEIVGEIRDEDEPEELDLVAEGQGSYLVRGGAEVEELEEQLQVDLGEADVTTVSGLVVAHLGKVPRPGEKIVLGALEIEILKADLTKIESMRVRKI